jgi:hypothetical protein
VAGGGGGPPRHKGPDLNKMEVARSANQ